MEMNKKNLMILGVGGGIILFFLGMALYILLGPSTSDYVLPRQISAMVRLGKAFWNGDTSNLHGRWRFLC